MKQLWEESLDFEDDLFEYLEHLFIGNILQLRPLHINNRHNLINPILIHEFLRIWELYSPGVFKFFYEIMHQQIGGVMQSLKQLKVLYLTDLQDKNWSALFIH